MHETPKSVDDYDLASARLSVARLRRELHARAVDTETLVVVNLLERLDESLRAIELLVRERFFDESASVARTFIDLLISTLFLLHDDVVVRARRALAFGQFIHVNRVRFVNRVGKSPRAFAKMYHQRGLVHLPEYTATKQEWLSNRPFKSNEAHWTGDLAAAAAEVGMGDAHDVLYALWSDIVHGGPDAVDRRMTLDPTTMTATVGVVQDAAHGLRPSNVCAMFWTESEVGIRKALGLGASESPEGTGAA